MTKLYEVSGRVMQIHPTNGLHWTRQELQEIVGGPIEYLSTVDGKIMVINETGKLTLTIHDLNILATRIYVNGKKEVILGPAVVVDTQAELDGTDES